MNKKDYYNSVTDQVLDLKNLAPVQSKICFDLEFLKKRCLLTKRRESAGSSSPAAGTPIPLPVR